MMTKAARANVLPAYRAILRELYKSVRIPRHAIVVLSHIYIFQSISPRATRSRTIALNFRAILQSAKSSDFDHSTQNAVTFLRSQRMYKVSHVRLALQHVSYLHLPRRSWIAIILS
jgi:hypothetical protein